MRRYLRIRFLLAMLATGWPAVASAQFGAIDELAKRFTDIAFFYNYGGFSPSSSVLAAGPEGGSKPHLLRSFGVEFAFTVYQEFLTVCTKRDSIAAGAKYEDTCGTMDVASERTCFYADTVLKEFHVTTDPAGKQSTDFIFTAKEKCKPPRKQLNATYDLGLGYTQLTHFHSKIPGVALSGTMTETPSVSLYRTAESGSSWYFGARTGLIKISDLLLESAGKSFTASPQTVEFGPVVGLGVPLPGIDASLIIATVEAAYMRRNFSSIRWSSAEGLPTSAPRTLNMSGWSIGLGFVLGIPKADGK